MSTRIRSVFDDRELVQLLRDEPELLAIADALVVTLGPSYEATRRAATLRRRAKRLAPLTFAVAALVALLLVAPWQRGPSLVENALAAIGNGPVLHVVVEQAQPDESLRDLATGSVLPRPIRTEIWFDGSRDLKKTVTTLDGRVLDETLETRDGGWSRGGRIYTCAWIAGHPVEATKAGVSCNPSGDNGTTPRRVPERPPTVDAALAGFVDRYRSALSSGEATLVGEGRLDGRDVVWLRIETENGPERVAVDAGTYAPLRIQAHDGAVSVDVMMAESIAFDPSTFTRPVPVAGQSGGAIGAFDQIELEQAVVELGEAVWLGRAWGDLRLVSVGKQERATGADRGATRDVSLYRLEYARRSVDGTIEDRPALTLYESRSCVVRVGWTCSPRDPMSKATVGLPFGGDGPIALLRHGAAYVSIWRSPDPATPSLLDAARAARPVAG